MSLRKAASLPILVCFTMLLLTSCNPVVHRTQTVVRCCSICGLELSRTEQEVALRQNELPGFQPVIEDRTGRCEIVGYRREIIACPACGRRISADMSPVSRCQPGAATLEEIVQSADSPCLVCHTWEDAIVTAEPAILQDGAVVVGPYDSGVSIEWVSEDTVWVKAGHGGTPNSVMELKDTGAQQGWTARRLIAWPTENGGSLYTVSPALGGKSLLAVVDGDFWLCEIPQGTGGRATAQRLGQGMIARPSPDFESAVLYTTSDEGEEPLYYDFTSGEKWCWAAVPNWEFPVTGAGCAWSPDGDNYLYVEAGYQYFVQPVPTGTPIPVSQRGETAFFGQWSPDGRLVAYSSFEGDPSPYYSPEGDLALPQVWEALKVWSLAERRTQRLAVPDRLVLSARACWSADGHAIAFAAGGLKPPGPDSEFRETWGDVYVSRLTEVGWSEPIALTQDGNSDRAYSPVEWSPDGRSLLVAVGSTTGVASEHRIFGLADGLAPAADSVVTLDGARAANWLSNERLIVIARDGEWIEQLEIRSRTGAMVEVLDQPDLPEGELSYIEYELSPLRGRVAWTMQIWSRDPSAQELRLWIKARRLEQ